MKARPTTKQKKAVMIMGGNGGNVTQAMLEAGYSPATANTPSKLTESAGFKSIAEQIPNSLLVEKHLELLNAQKIIRTYKKGEEIESEETIDNQAISKGLDMAYKIKGIYAAEKHDIRVVQPIIET